MPMPMPMSMPMDTDSYRSMRCDALLYQNRVLSVWMMVKRFQCCVLKLWRDRYGCTEKSRRGQDTTYSRATQHFESENNWEILCIAGRSISENIGLRYIEDFTFDSAAVRGASKNNAARRGHTHLVHEERSNTTPVVNLTFRVSPTILHRPGFVAVKSGPPPPVVHFTIPLEAYPQHSSCFLRNVCSWRWAKPPA